MVERHRIYFEDDARDVIHRPPTGRPKIQKKKWLDVTWTYTEFAPVGRLTGFEVVLINGTDPDDPSIYIRAPEIVAPDVRRYTVSVALGTNLSNARSAVRALYGGARSAWTVQGIGQVLGADGEELPTLTELNDVQTQAATAQNDATVALQELSDITADGKLTGNEKKVVIRQYNELINQRADINAQADAFGITTAKTNYNNALDALISYLGGLLPAWNNTGATTTISRTIWNSNWEAAFQGRQTLLNTVAQVNQSSAANANQIATNAQNDATAAQAAAGNAQVDASQALVELDDIAADGKLTPNEKKKAVLDYAEITGQQSGIDARASAFGITTEKTAYDSAISALTSYLNGLSPAWNSTASTTAISRTVWNANWQDVYDKRQALMNKIAEKAGALADWAQIYGTDKPEDGATVGATAEEKSLIRSMRNAFLEDFSDPNYHQVWINFNSGLQEYSSPASSVLGGGAALLHNAVSMYYNERIPFDPAKLYRIEFRVNVATTGGDPDRLMYLGLAGYDASQNLCNASGVNSLSSQHYICASSYNAPLSTWLTLVAYFKGNAAGNASYNSAVGANHIGNPAKLHENVRFFAPIAYVNYPGKLGYTYIDYVKIDVIEVQDQKNLPMVQSDVASVNLSQVCTATDAGSTATISVAAHSVQFGSFSVSYNSGSITGLLFSKKYYVYCDDPGYDGGAVIYYATTNWATAKGGTFRRVVDVITTPANGSSGTGGAPPPEECVATGMWLLPDLRVDDAMAGDLIDVWDIGETDVSKGPIHAIRPAPGVQCVRLVMESGAQVVCSVSTPVTGPDGEVRRAPAAQGMQLGVLHGDAPLVWERVVAVKPAGLRTVYHLSCGNISFAAGVDPRHRVITHNQYYKP